MNKDIFKDIKDRFKNIKKERFKNINSNINKNIFKPVQTSIIWPIYIKVQYLLLKLRFIIQKPIFKKSGLFLILLILWNIGLEACSSEPSNSMKHFVQVTKLEKGGALEPLPEIKIPPTLQYTANKFRDPFQPGYKLMRPLGVLPAPKGGPNKNRPKEPLEAFPLESLKMVGILQKDGVIWALIKDPNGHIHHVGIGNYMGLNYGSIEKITEKQIDVREWFLNNQNQWEQRVVHLNLVVVIPTLKQP